METEGSSSLLFSAFPPANPQVFELYWSAPQLRARAHPNLLAAQKFLMSYWQPSPSLTPNPLVYADRLRIRQPGDASFALGPHVDAGSVERWEKTGYGLGSVYDAIWNGDWERYDPWESSGRVSAVADLYNGAGACSMFRMFQGWLSMSATGPGEGTLLVNPLFGLATAYFLMRPFFRLVGGMEGEAVLEARNWVFEGGASSILQGATMGHCQELNDVLHPHLELARSMVHVPQIRPGDYVVWHCDSMFPLQFWSHSCSTHFSPSIY